MLSCPTVSLQRFQCMTCGSNCLFDATQPNRELDWREPLNTPFITFLSLPTLLSFPASSAVCLYFPAIICVPLLPTLQCLVSCVLGVPSMAYPVPPTPSLCLPPSLMFFHPCPSVSSCPTLISLSVSCPLYPIACLCLGCIQM